MQNYVTAEDISIGQKLPCFTTTVTRTDIVKYAGAGGDFNPLHHDDELAKSLGLPSVFAMGLLHGGYLAKVLTDWTGPASIKQYRIRFLSPVWPGDELTCSGVVMSMTTALGKTKVQCQLYVDSQNGVRVIEGDATVLLPNINDSTGI